MRFTKCDVCTLANEALDVERKKGGVGWLTPAMESVKQHLLDHYEVCAWCVLVYVCIEVDHLRAFVICGCFLCVSGFYCCRRAHCLLRHKECVFASVVTFVHHFPLLYPAAFSGREAIQTGLHGGQDAGLRQPTGTPLHCDRRGRPVGLCDPVLLPRDQRQREGLEDEDEAHRSSRVRTHVHVLYLGVQLGIR